MPNLTPNRFDGTVTLSPSGFNFSINLTEVDSAFGAFIGYGFQAGAGVADEMCKGFQPIAKSDWLAGGAAIPGRGGFGVSANLGPGGIGGSGLLKAYGQGFGIFVASGKTKTIGYSMTWNGK